MGAHKLGANIYKLPDKLANLIAFVRTAINNDS